MRFRFVLRAATLLLAGLVSCVSSRSEEGTPVPNPKSAGAAESATANPTNDVIPMIYMTDVPLLDAMKNLSRQGEFGYILDPRVPGSTLGPGRLMEQPTVNIRWKNLTAQQAFDRLLASNNMVAITNPATALMRIAPANAGSRLIPDSQLSADTNRLMSEAFEDWDLFVTLRALGKQAGKRISFDSLLSAPALGLDGDISDNWSGRDLTSQQAIAVLLDNYDLVMIEDPATSSARITLNTHGRTNLLNLKVPLPPAKDGWRTVDVHFRMTIPANWQKDKVIPLDSNCGTYQGDTATLEFDEFFMGYSAERAQAGIDTLKKKEADSKLLKPGEEIWHVDGRIAYFAVKKVDSKQSGQRRFSNFAEFYVPYPGPPGYLSIQVYYQSDQDLPTVRRVLQSIQWKKADDQKP